MIVVVSCCCVVLLCRAVSCCCALLLRLCWRLLPSSLLVVDVDLRPNSFFWLLWLGFFLGCFSAIGCLSALLGVQVSLVAVHVARSCCCWDQEGGVAFCCFLSSASGHLA